MKNLIDRVYLPPACLYHYLNMAKGNYRDYLQNEQVKIKKYFYVLRPILACKWIQKYNSIPPLEFQLLIEEIVPEGILKTEINKLLERKKKGDELDFEPRIEIINQFIKREVENVTLYAQSLDIQLDDPTDLLDQLFRDALVEVWETEQ
jgi:uncharacterized protein